MAAKTTTVRKLQGGRKTPEVKAEPPLSAVPPRFQLTVVNSCQSSHDIVLPTRPQPSLQVDFYANGWRPQMEVPFGASEENSRLGGANTTAKKRTGRMLSSHSRPPPGGMPRWPQFARCTAALDAEQWSQQVAHICLGRHSTLPPNQRLVHPFIGRLHLRIVFVDSQPMHTCLLARFPRHRHQNPHPLGYVTPYYLLLSYCENPVYVNDSVVPPGHSHTLEEGDVISFLECAFDEEFGVLEHRPAAEGPLTSGPAAPSSSPSHSNGHETCEGRLARLPPSERGNEGAASMALPNFYDDLNMTLLGQQEVRDVGHGEATLCRRGAEVPRNLRLLVDHWRGMSRVDAAEGSVDGVNSLLRACADAQDGADCTENSSPLQGSFVLDTALALSVLVPREQPQPAATPGQQVRAPSPEATAASPPHQVGRAPLARSRVSEWDTPNRALEAGGVSLRPAQDEGVVSVSAEVGEESPIRQLLSALQREGISPSTRTVVGAPLRLSYLREDETVPHNRDEGAASAWHETFPVDDAWNEGAGGNRGTSPPPPSMSTVGFYRQLPVPTAVPFLAYRPAPLPVYIFARRCASPGATTHESVWRQRRAQVSNASPFVFYYDEEVQDESVGEGVPTLGTAAAVSDGGVWVDESSPKRRAAAKGRKRRR